jgi:hypothetical protein
MFCETFSIDKSLHIHTHIQWRTGREDHNITVQT